ncbi:SMI1/KNR4 family protein [Streptomyces telluris]|uniref:SMI1/KNR4 family protein n=1 Tax=Streptomyces telluris TaxID=2720021 RepID=A0A9X2LG46_9ACTN|nr:SMI1/KNR4 family protein [Streptomyces telluris]MCQ8770605.1 SMI1/KNR4 family protein [Streptomyces telluris]
MNPEGETSPAASRSAVDAIEGILRQNVPGDLEGLLLEVNGVMDKFGTDLVWSAERIVDDNSAFRVNPSFAELYASFDSLLFFGDNGGGDQFAFFRNPDRSEVVVWDHETDERRVVAETLEQYVVRCLESGGEDWYRD